MTNPVIAINNLSKSFAGKTVVNNIDLHVDQGEVFGFVGPNGSGKTTTMRMLCGLLTPDSGSGSCLGYDIFTQKEQIKQQIGYMTQKFSFYTDLTVEENLKFMASIYNLPNKTKRVEKTLTELGLNNRRRQLTGELSDGWKQRVALAACLIHEPKVLLLDEPTAGLDPLARREFWNTIHRLSEEGTTSLISTHYMDEAQRCTRLVYLAYGNLLVLGTVQEVIAKTKLYAWEIDGAVSTALLNKTSQINYIAQAALLEGKIHLCGYEKKQIELSLRALQQQYANIKWRAIEPTLEDAFICLGQQSRDLNPTKYDTPAQ